MDVALVIVASVNFDECPIDQKVPIILIVIGALDIAGKVLSLTFYNFKWVLARHLGTICGILTWVSFIAGSVIIYRIYEPNYEKELGLYCNRETYLFGFSLFTMAWIILVIGVIIGISYICYWLITFQPESEPKANQDNTNTNHVVNVNELF
ncbi:hypothetical protein ILUMI_16662 [Ignelater luminosus]|uniref:Uncharacterized protein n=1 Tax=Ignelater luminosus TaxID=2038154 RepID=A0A8K0CQV6_IGNLU|nr:hypothetical protein ILUMI_16662 [Ignelater luminosus]